MSASNKQTIALVILGAVFAVVLVAGFAGSVARRQYIGIAIAFLLLGFTAAVIWVGIWFNQRRVQNMFRHPTPERLIEHYHASVLRAQARKIPNADAAAADLAALAAAVYGQYDRAREELERANWSEASPAYCARRLDVLALIALLEERFFLRFQLCKRSILFARVLLSFLFDLFYSLFDLRNSNCHLLLFLLQFF